MGLLDVLLTAARRLTRRRGSGLLAVGTPAPDFDVPDHLGQRRRLSDYHGRRVVLWFYPMADTPG